MRVDDFCGRVQRVDFRQGLGDGIAYRNPVILDGGSCLGAGIVLEFSDYPVGADAPLAVAGD